MAMGTAVYRSGYGAECISLGACPETARGFSLRWDGVIAVYCWSGKNYFALPIKSEKQNTAEAIGTGSFKIFQNSFESLGFIHISISSIKNQQLINQIDQTSLHSH